MSSSILITAIIIGGLTLANKYPRYFGFLAIEFGVKRSDCETEKLFMKRSALFWFKVAVLILAFTVLIEKLDVYRAFKYSAEFSFFAKAILCPLSFFRSAVWYFLSLFQNS